MRRLPADEETRNALLRRIDWRFLLPTAQVATTVYAGADRRLRAALDLLADNVSDLAVAAPPVADLAVLAEPNRPTLEAARASLRPGGSCYVEWSSPLTGGFGRARRTLLAAGFVDVACYWAWPPPARAAPRFWVPPASVGARTHFLATRPLRAGPTGTLRRRVQRIAWQTALHLGALVPMCVVARKPGVDADARRSDGMNDDLAARLRTGWAREWQLGPSPRCLSWVLLTGGTASFNKVVGMVCADREPGPRVALKLARGATAETGLRTAACALEAVAVERPHLPGVPRLLFCERFTSGLALAESVVSGRPLSELVSRANLRQLAAAATEWFSELAGRPPQRPRTDWWPRLVAPILDAFDGLPGPAVVPDLVARTRRLFAPLQDLPLVISHGDAGPLNVLMDNEGHISVIDWEDCEPLGLPVGDLVALLTYLTFHLENPWQTGKYREVYRSLLDGGSDYGRLRADCLASYARRVGLPASATAPLALLPWVQRSLREHRGMLDATLGSEGVETFRRGLYVSLWEEELRAAERLAN